MVTGPGLHGKGGSAGEVFAAFLKLGLTSFGGPVAHLGFFHRELIERRRWVDEPQYAQLLALSQLLPGPASSQLGFALGMIRAGWPGALAAFVAFTTPSALLLFGFARLLPLLQQPHGQAVIHGLKLVAVAVVGQGVLVMARRLAPDARRALIAAAAGAVVAVSNSGLVQLAVVVMGAGLGLIFCRGSLEVSGGPFHLRYGPRLGVLLLTAFAVLLIGALAAEHLAPAGTATPAAAAGLAVPAASAETAIPAAEAGSAAPLVAAAAAFYRSGALVFGGGHVVVPLLQQTVVSPGWVSSGDFLAGYGAAQAVPGPMFSVASFLGARLLGGAGGPAGALVALLAIFLPGLLLISGALPLWRTIASRQASLSALAGVNAVVVGLLAAALYNPVWTSTVLAPGDFAIALVGFVLLVATPASVLVVLAWSVLASLAQAIAGA